MNDATMFYCCDNVLNTTDAFSDKSMMLSGGMVHNLSENFAFTIPQCKELFIDSGGFQATARWDMSYPYEPVDLYDWAESINADYVAMPDFACEPELHDTSVMHRVHRTIEEHAFAQAQYDEREYSFQLIPVLQGYYADQYEECVRLFESEGLIRDYMAIGTVCKRDTVDAIHNVVDRIERLLPDVDLHMFGMTLNAWKDRRMWGRFESADTAAWNWGGSTQAEKIELLHNYSAKVDAIRDQMRHQTTL